MKLKTSFFVKVTNTQTANFILLMHNYFFEFYSALKKQSFVQYFFGKRFSFLSLLLIVFFAVNVPSAVAQVCGTSGWDGPQNAVPPVNTYFPLGTSTTLTAGSKTITLLAVPPNDPNYNLSYGITPIKSGDLILIIQMQDATIDYSNSNKYGSGTTGSGPDGKGGTGYTSLGSTGKFEYVVATSNVPITGGTLNFRGGGAGGGAVNTYTNSAATTTKGQSRFQVVRVPQYSNLVLTADITTPPYNGSVGGLIAFDVAGTMQFNGFKVDASERGFRGGYGPVANSNANNSTDYVLLSSSTKSVGKGEGVAGTPRYMWDGFNQVDNVAEGLPSGSYGRGAPANAGGGGNDHNAGGGGGGNAGFGGLGGMGWQGAGGDVDPKTGGGRPGSSLPLTVGNLIMGGGGGGGDANNATSGVKGGVGGGIVLINVEKIDGAGVIKANGGVGQAGTYGSQPDGAGGGGAGGSIFVRSLAASPTANLTLQANGGNGGNTINDTGSITPHGPGGGGGGGFIYTQVASAAIASSTTGGISGKTNNGAGITHGAQDGLAGITKTFVTTDLPTYLQGGGSICYPALDVTLSELNAGLSGARLAGTTATYKLRITNNVGGGNAGDVNADFILPNGFSLNSVSATLSGSTAGPTSPTFTAGSTGVISLGSYNISPGDYVEFTISVDIALTVPSGIYHASAQATYLDPTRTVANPLRKITANNNAFSGTNVTYETGGITNVPGTNYDGDLASATAEDVYVTAVPPLADCNAIVNGDFGFGSPGLYNGQSYFGWEGVNPGDQVSIYNLLGLFQGALIKGTYSLKQNILSIKPSTGYQLTFSYAKQFGCLTPSSAKITVKILDASTLQVLGTQNFSADLISKSGTVSFTTGTNTNALILEIIDNNSPNGSCSVYVDDFVITSPLVTGLNNINVSCKSLSDGSISITSLSNAAAPYKVSYSSDGGINYSSQINSGIITSSTSPLVFPNLSAGNYIIKVLDQNGCPTYRNITINEPDLLALSESHTTILCNGSTSTVSLTATGGTAPYQYSDDGGLTYQTQNTFPGLVAGNYNFLVKDTHNCTATISATITQPSLINLSEAHSAIVCNGGSSDVTLTATGGTGVLKYSADNLTYQTSGVFNGLTAGSYTFYTKDDNSCLKSIVVNITEPAVLTLTGTSTAVLCNGGTSEVTLTATGGTGAYQYSRDGTNFQTGNTFTGLTAGTYSFIVKDANGCVTTVSAVITEPAELKLTADRTEIRCNGGTSEVTLTATGGTGAYQYSRDGTSFQSGNTFSSLTAGTYTFTAKDANGCVTTVSAVITEPAELKLTADRTEIRCNGGTSEVTLTATGGTGAYQYSRDGTSFQSGNTFSSLTAGTYTFTAKDANGCVTTVSAVITEPAELKLTADRTEIRCNGGTSEVTLTATGGTGAYQYSRDGTNFQTGNTFTGLTAGTYSFIVKDANGCVTTVSAVITEPAELKLTADRTEIRCNGGTSEVTLTATGGTGAYQYSRDGTSFQSGNTFSSLTAGTYTFTAKDANGCVTTVSAVITEPAELKLTADRTEIRCNGGTSEVTLTATGGTGAYQYSRDGTSFQSGNTFSSLTAGTYTFTAKDANGCVTTVSAVITEPAELKLTADRTEIRCNGGTSEVTLTATGGTGAYQYSRDGTSFQSGNTFSSLTAGTYTFTAKDANGCVTTVSAVITEPAELKLTADRTEIRCNGGTSEVTLTATGGTGAYQYSRDGTNYQSGNTFTGLTAGTYSFIVKDANGCTSTVSAVITGPAELKLTADRTEIRCNGGTSEVTLTATGGTGAYQYSRDGTSFQSGNTFTGLTAGTYSFIVKDANGCVTTVSAVITEPAELKLRADRTEIRCNGGTSEVTLTATGGTGAYQYSRDGTNFQSGNTFTGLTAGTYSFIVKDANGCVTTVSAVITEPAELKLTADRTEIRCNGGTSEVTLTATGGTGAYQYSRDGTNFQTGNTFTGLTAGTYSFIVKDANGCVTTVSAVITEPAELKLTADRTEIRCNGGTSEVTLTATGGTGAYQYSRDGTNFQTGNTFTGLTAGTYSFIVKDANGCVTTVSAVITEPAELKLTADRTEIRCNGGTSEVTLTATGGTGAYQYSRDGTNFQTGNTFTGLTAGTYSFIVKDANGCVTTVSAVITEPAELKLTADRTEIRCNGGTSEVTLTATGGTGAYQYSRDGTSFQSGNTFSSLTAGTYTFTAKDANGCVTTVSAVITEPAELKLTADRTEIRCNGGTSEVTLTATGGTGAYQYSRDGTSFQSGNTFSSLTAGTYTFTAKDANGCVTTVSAVITEPAELKLTADRTEIRCNGGTSEVTLTATGGTGAYQYSRDGTSFQSGNTFSSLTAGTYTFTAKDANGCVTTVSAVITEPAELKLTADRTEIRCNGGTSEVTLTATGGTGAYQYSRDGTNYQSGNTFTGLTAGTYSFIVKDANGCTSTVSAVITGPAELKLTADRTEIRCNGGTSDVELKATGGTGAYQYSRDGTNYQSVNTFTGLTAGTYSFIVKDANGCTSTVSAVITEPAELKLTADRTEIRCNGGTSEVTLTATGGTGAYQYSRDGTSFQSGNTFSSLTAGTYTFTAKDANGCVTTVSAVITEPAELKLTADRTEIRCNGGTSEVTLTATGGTGAYQYSRDGTSFQSGNTFSSLTAGTYTFTAKDANGCVTTVSAVITEPAELKLTADRTEIRCNGGTSEVTLTATGGTGAYQYSRDGTNYQSGNTFTGLTAGTYSFIVKDANGCTSTVSAVITGPAELKLTADRTEIRCNGGTSDVELKATGGTGAYQYSRDGTNYQSVNTFTGLTAGTYSFIVKDANGCTSTVSAVITEPAELKLTADRTEIRCNGGTSEVTLTATGGTGAYQYSRDGTNYQSVNTFTGLTAGTYSFIVKDANGCTSTVSAVITGPAELKLTADRTEIRCNGGTSEVTLTATGGTGAYQYSRDGTNFQTGNTFTGLTAGTYSFIVKDANGCVTTVSAVITEPAELKLTADRTEIRCFGGTSEVTLTATGGTGAYQYSRDGTSFQSGNTFTGLTVGTYSFIVKDANGCQATVIVDIAQPIAPLTLNSTKTDVKCYGDATGTIDLTATGGTGNYTFAWNNGKTTEDMTGLTAGTYQVTVTDANGCTAAKSVTIAQPSAPLTVTETHTDVKCYGGATGSIDITVTGGTAPYSYLWDNGATVQDLADISSGTYTFTVTDGNGCTAAKSVAIVQPSAPLTVSETHTNVKCFGAASGSISISVSGGKAPYVYSWSNGAITQNLSALEAGDYTLTVKDANNCLATIAITISQPLAPLTLIENHEDILCYGDATGSISLKVDGGTAPYRYLWTNNKESKDLEGLKAGIYAVTVTDAKGCTIGTQIQISQPAAPLSITETHQNVACFGANTGSISINVLGGTAPYTYEWSNGVEIQNLDNLFAGVYEIKVTDKNGCTIVKKIQITQPLAPLALSETHINNGCYSDNIGKITLTVTGGVSPYTYRWSNGATTKNLANLAPGIYQVVVTDKNGCTQTLSTQILPLKPFIINEKIEQIKCFGENSGKINLVLISGEAPYQVSWSNGANGFNLQNLAPGNYTYFAKDSFGCVQTNTITITQPQPLSVKTEVKNTTCKYSPDGAIKLNVSGGSPPYRFIWNSTDRGANSSLLNVNAGKYDINIIDANNCSLQISAEILPGNCAPSADNDKYETTEDTPIIIHTPGIIINDIDPDDDDLRVTLGSAKDPNGETGDVDANQTVFKTKNGKITLNHDGSFTYIPNKNFFGTEYFIYEVTDGQLKSNFAQVTIVVTQVNDPPSAADDFFTTTEDIPLTGSLGSNDFDPEGDPLKYVVTNPPSSGNLTLNPDGTFTYVPEENYNGTITFDYQVCDPQGLCDQAKATIVINPANDAPIAQDDRFSIQRNGQISQTVTSNDSDPDRDALQFTKLTEPTNGTLVFNTNGTFVYQPKANFKGIDQFTYKACDPLGLCDEATVTLIVQPIVTVNLIPKEAIIKEGDSIKVTAVLTESLVEDVTVYLNYSGTAEQNKDFVLSNNYLSLLIPANQSETTQYFKINTILDDIKDDNETVISNITSTSKPAFVNIGNNSTVTIKDVYPEAIKNTPSENPDINPDPLVSPNGDGAGNESFIIYNITKYPNNEVLIFNRWGNKVYQTKGYDNKGNSFKGVANVGILTNTNKDLVDGVYYYIIYTQEDNKKKMNKGYLILKR